MMLHPKGVENLRKAILKSAIYDYLTWPPFNSERTEAIRFFWSEFYDLISPISAEAMMDALDKIYERKHHDKLVKWMEENN